MDVAKAYERVVEAILERDVDLVIHSGDVFDTIRPATHVVVHFIRQTLKLTRRNVPYLGIAGNHETPRLRTTTAALEYANFAGAYFAHGFSEEYEPVDIRDARVGLTLVPHGAVGDGGVVVTPDREADVNILVTHGTVPGLVVKGHELGEIDLPDTVIDGDFDYVALGHYHDFHKHKENAYYAGATERFGFGEVDSKTGFVVVEFDGSGVEIEHVEIPSRPMIDLPKINAADMSPSDLTDAIRQAAEKADIDEAIVRLKVTEAPAGVTGGVDRALLRDLVRRCLNFSLEVTEVGTEDMSEGDAGASFGSLEDEFRAFVEGSKERKEIEAAFADRFLKRGLDYLGRAGEERR